MMRNREHDLEDMLWSLSPRSNLRFSVTEIGNRYRAVVWDYNTLRQLARETWPIDAEDYTEYIRALLDTVQAQLAQETA